jgi:hypothetical protein
MSVTCIFLFEALKQIKQCRHKRDNCNKSIVINMTTTGFVNVNISLDEKHFLISTKNKRLIMVDLARHNTSNNAKQ